MFTFFRQLGRVPFVRDVATLQAGQMIGTACGFLSSILYARLLGISGYGEYAIILAFSSVVRIPTNIGQGTTTLTFLSEAYGRKDWDKWNKSILYYIVASALSGCMLALLVLIAPILTELIYADRTLGEIARLIFLSAIIEPFFIFITLILQTVREVRLLAILENARVTLQLGSGVLLLILGYGIAGIFIGMMASTAAFALITFLLFPVIRKKHALPGVTQAFKKASIWHFAKDGFWIGLDKNIGNLYPNIFLAVFGIFQSETVVGLLRLAFKLGTLPAALILGNISRMASSVIPALAGSGQGIYRSIKRLTLYTGALHMAATIAALVVIPPFISLVYGQEYQVAMYPFFVILLLHGTMVVHAILTPILRLYSRIYLATACNVAGFAIALIVFLSLQNIVRPTIALYISLGIYHTISLLVVFPAFSLLRQKRRQTAQ